MINLFVSSADELYGPITTIRRDGHVKHIPWTAFVLKPHDWDRVQDLRTIITISLRCHCIVLPLAQLSQDANKIQQIFSDENCVTLWQAIPALEELQMAWEAKEENPKYDIYRAAI